MQQLNDKDLYALCKKYGENALHWRRKFIGLLPEVNRRKLYERRGFRSIFEFAKKLCGLSEEQVRLALNLEKRFVDKPALKELLTSGQVSINKLTRVTSVATPENEGFWAEKAQQLSQNAIETLVRDEKRNGLSEPKNDEKSLRAQKLGVKRDGPNSDPGLLNLEPDVMEELLELQCKGIDVNQLLRVFLEQRKLEIAREKERLSAEVDSGAKSRYIPVKIRTHLQNEFGIFCSISGCQRPAQIIHHTQRFALAQTHNPKYLAPLCREHHAIAHAIDLKAQAKRNAR